MTATEVAAEVEDLREQREMYVRRLEDARQVLEVQVARSTEVYGQAWPVSTEVTIRDLRAKVADLEGSIVDVDTIVAEYQS